jgi:hypothetical protein
MNWSSLVFAFFLVYAGGIVAAFFRCIIGDLMQGVNDGN